MDLESILFAITLVLSGLALFALLASIFMEWWLPKWWHIQKWRRLRNQRLSDYDSDDPMLHAYIDGLINTDWYWKCIYTEWDLKRNEGRLLVTARTSADLYDRIQDRYHASGAENAYKRALQTLQNYPYCAYDAEMHDLCQQALTLREGRCLRCDGAGWRWMPYTSGAYSEETCVCKK